MLLFCPWESGAVGRVAVTDEERKILMENKRSAPYVLMRVKSRAVLFLAGRTRPHPGRGRRSQGTILVPRTRTAELELCGPEPARTVPPLSTLSQAWLLGAPGESNVVVIRAGTNWHTSRGEPERLREDQPGPPPGAWPGTPPTHPTSDPVEHVRGEAKKNTGNTQAATLKRTGPPPGPYI